MYSFYKIKLNGSFTTEGVVYDSTRTYLVTDSVFAKIPQFLIEEQKEYKMPVDRRKQLGLLVGSPVSKVIVDSLPRSPYANPSCNDLIFWCISHGLLGERLIALIQECYQNVSQSYLFWEDLGEVLDSLYYRRVYRDIDIPLLIEKLKELNTKRGSIATTSQEII